MKRTLGILLALTMVLSMLAGISVSAAATYEITFEAGSGTSVGDLTAEGWKVRKMYGTGDTGKFNNNVIPSTTVFHSGAQGIQYKAYNKNSALVSTPLSRLGQGKSYNISAWHFQESLVDETAKIKMVFSGGTSKEFSAPVEAGKWVEIKGEFTVPAGETAQLFIISSSTSNAVHYWDDIIIASTTGDDTPAGSVPETPAQPAPSAPAATPAPSAPAVPAGPVVPVVEAKNTYYYTFEAGSGTEAGGLKGQGWSVKKNYGTGDNANYKNNVTPATSPAHTGTASVMYKAYNKNSALVSSTLLRLAAGKSYNLSAWNYQETLVDETVKVKVVFSGGTSKEFSAPAEAGKWVEIKGEFTVPAGETAQLFLMSSSTSNAVHYWDDILIASTTGEDNPAPTQPAAPTEEKKEDEKYSDYVPMPATSKELLVNGSFEEVNGKGAMNWDAQKGWDTEQSGFHISLSDTEAHTGTHSVHIQSSGANPFVKQNIYNPVVGAIYQISVWYKIASDTANAGFKVEWYGLNEDGSTPMLGGVWVKDPPVPYKTGNWEQVSYRFNVPEGCNKVTCYIRVYSQGDVYFDDASCYIIEEPKRATAKLFTDEIFYYSDMYEGVATITPNYEYFPNIATIEACLKKDGAVVANKNFTPYGAEKVEWHFPLSAMTEKDAHTMEIVAKDAAGAVIGDPITEIIHKYPRPSILGKDGNIYLDGKQFNPVFVYHMNRVHLGYANEMGVNVSQARGSVSYDGVKKYLDEADKYGVKVIVPLYAGMKPAGHIDNVQNTTQIVSGLKDHPALLAWMVMDEAWSHWPDRFDLFYDSYKLIRDLDPNHPIYILQNTPDQYGIVGKYADILAHDPYTSAKSRIVAQHVAGRTTTAVNAVNYGTPIWTLNRCMGGYIGEKPEATDRGLPTITECRSHWYQSLFVGSTGVGYYSYSDCVPGYALHETPLYADLAAFAKEEQVESLDHFLNNLYPIFSENRMTDAWYSSYVKDGELRMIVMNRWDEEKTVSVPLTSDNGAIAIGDFTAELVYGGTGTVTGNGTLNVTLEGSGVSVYKITPSVPVDYSTLKTTKFRDLDTHAWAAQEIREMAALGLVYGVSDIGFMPGKNITRADFASFLIKTLGLTADTTDNFADVNPDAPYAKDLAIGKALGILKGVGNNEYNPYAEISRQDLMVICARGMRAVNKLQATGGAISFPDAGLIADYATADVSAMVQDGVIKGNADGTINPLGNATRAEAALIMHRIYNK